MKKLSLGKLKFASAEVLKRSQLSTIYGGSGEDCSHRLLCNDGTEILNLGGTCPAIHEENQCKYNGGPDTCVETGC